MSGYSSGYREFYKSNLDRQQFEDLKKNEHFAFLAKGAEPMFVVSSNIDADFQKALRKGFMPISYSSFNGPYEAPKMPLRLRSYWVQRLFW